MKYENKITYVSIGTTEMEQVGWAWGEVPQPGTLFLADKGEGKTDQVWEVAQVVTVQPEFDQSLAYVALVRKRHGYWGHADWVDELRTAAGALWGKANGLQ